VREGQLADQPETEARPAAFVGWRVRVAFEDPHPIRGRDADALVAD
jgi:hypothetical protein